MARVVLVRRACADCGDADLAAGAPLRRALLGAHGRAPAAGRPRRAAARARPHGPAVATRAECARLALAAGLRPPRGRHRRPAPSTSTSGTFRRSTRARSSTDAVHALQHLLFVSFGIGIWMALLGPLPSSAWFGNGAKIGYIVAVRLIQSVLGNALLWSSGVLHRRYAAGEADPGISTRQRPERRGRDHDGRGVDRHDPAVLLALPACGARERREGRRWSSSRRRGAWS